jgi:hypothetical protein
MATGKRLMPTIKLTVAISVMRVRVLRVLKAVVMSVLLGAWFERLCRCLVGLR